MTRDEFKAVSVKLRIAYKRQGFMENPEEFELWLEHFGDLKQKFMAAAVHEFISQSVYPPTIADIKNRYDVLAEDDRKYNAEIMGLFRLAQSLYPGSGLVDDEQEELEAFKTYIRRFPERERRVRAEEFLNLVTGYIRNCEGCGRKEMPTFKEYIEGKR